MVYDLAISFELEFMPLFPAKTQVGDGVGCQLGVENCSTGFCPGANMEIFMAKALSEVGSLMCHMFC